MKRLVSALIFAAVALLAAPTAAADGTISDMVENTFAEEMPFWAYLYDNGFGYLDSKQVYSDGQVVCANRGAGVPDDQIVQLLKMRGYSLSEAQAIVIATGIPTQAHPVCSG